MFTIQSYNFRMEKILEFRIKHEKSIIERYSLLQKDLQQHRKNLSTIITEHEIFKSSSTQKKRIEDLRQHSLYNEKIEEEIKLQNQLIENITAKIEKTRLELVEAQKDRKIMEKLKEKDYLKYKEIIKKLEQKELDELGVLNYARHEG